MTDLERLPGLLREHRHDPYPRVLTCAPDVAWELTRALLLASQEAPLDLITQGQHLIGAAGTGIIVFPRYEPGRWKLTRHDRCEVLVGGGDPEHAMIATHENCTVLGEGATG